MSDSFNAQVGDTDADNVSESQEIVDRHYERMAEQSKMNEQRRSNMAKEQLAKETLAVKREDIAAKERIAKQRNNRPKS